MTQIYGQEKEIDGLVENISKVLGKYYWPKLGAGNPHAVSDAAVLQPLHVVANYIYEAWDADSNKQDESSYTGAKFLLSILKADGRRFTSSNEEANSLYLAGMRLAKHLWDSLDSRGEAVFRAEFEQISDLLLNRYRKVGNDAAE